MHWNNIVVICCVLGVTGAGQFELLCCVGELERSVWVGRVWEQGTFPLQQVSYSLKKLPKTKSQGSLSEAIQLLTRPGKKKRVSALIINRAECFIQTYLIKCLGFVWKFSRIPQDLLHISLWMDSLECYFKNNSS